MREGHGAFDFWSPHDTQSALRLRQSTRLDEVRENTGGFEDGDTSAAVVVGTRTFVIEVATVNDFARRGIGAGNRTGHDGPVAGADLGFDVGVESYGFS